MKNTLLAIALTLGFLAGAQSNVYFKIDHFLGASPFAFSTTTTNNLGNSFNVTRLEYYISEIVIIHDGGQQTAIAEKWILVNAGAAVNEMLGSFNITTLEGVKFAVGVNPSVNNLDPASYPMSHPLAPKSPSMHWGWAAGYRFVAMEGQSGSSMNQNYEFHALGNVNYFTHTIQTAGVANGSDLTISLNADYEMALKDIDVSSGAIVHGEVGAAVNLLKNFNYHVFTSSEGNASIGTEELANAISTRVYPNPTKGNVLISTKGNQNGEIEYVVTDILGQNILRGVLSESGQESISIKNNGMYFVSILKNGNAITTEKIIVAQ